MFVIRKICVRVNALVDGMISFDVTRKVSVSERIGTRASPISVPVEEPEDGVEGCSCHSLDFESVHKMHGVNHQRTDSYD